ncbi:hypothetical protein [Caballeronia glathei]|uniref:Chromosome partition protein Smc n=1 Tax=Caballeronia glathei TaxID=60547 RepID=A0A069PJR4_9BURK|nr:hypothetical protein [Caballeronia glathei]KDR40840.1 hypothetical protein BG61_22670 [Caballeronia glathei]
MQSRKTSNTSLGAVTKESATDLVSEVVPFDPFDEFVIGMRDPNAATRENIAVVARQIFGGGDENKDFIAKLVESMLAVAESRAKIVAEQVILGGTLTQMVVATINHHTQKVGDTFNARRKAVSLALEFTEKSLQIKPSSARCYMRCHAKFGDEHEALRVFNLGELNILAAHEVTHEQITAIMEKKKTSPEMSRKDVDEMLRALQRQEEAIDDRDRQLENVQSLLEDSKVQLDVSERESQHLKEELAANKRHIVEKEKSLADMRELLVERTSGYSAMEKEVSDKSKQVDELTAEVAALRSAKPMVETKEVIVEKLPESLANVTAAVTASLAELGELDAKKSAAADELAALTAQYEAQKAEMEAATKAQRSMDELTEAWADVAGKMAKVQAAVQASREPQIYKPALEALSGMLRKYIEEIEAALKQ